MIFFTIVVLPALSRPLQDMSGSPIGVNQITYSIKILISLSFSRAFLNIDNILNFGVKSTEARA
ncbi:hypothetical protein Tdes44962_MAKER04865 [Teratosphaeria destructans]|uniref:Uncharacterized protein n=1 Tax=Teratosphaeria destructans TaxID=418781 RepID=A0A9W7SLC0_9PEZI|nr:hypothetical protein Tdes44962_MAKER04865 [Teratosphaeria destructans]